MRFFVYLCCLICFNFPAVAQILNMSGTQDPLDIPVDFLESMQNCQPYEKTVMSAPEGIVTKMIYKISGKKNNKCEIQIDGYTNVTVHITQSCQLTPEQASEYAGALSRFQEKNYPRYKNLKRILNDPDYISATEIMTNEELCSFHRDGIDETFEFRKKLSDCTPFKETQTLDSVDIEREITEYVNGSCKINVTFTQRLPNMELRAKKITERMWSHIDKFKEAHYHYACAFDDDKRKEYLAVLEALVVPEEDGFDFSAVQRFTQASEMEFIYKNCFFVVK